jgi:hypothetical protein
VQLSDRIEKARGGQATRVRLANQVRREVSATRAASRRVSRANESRRFGVESQFRCCKRLILWPGAPRIRVPWGGTRTPTVPHLVEPAQRARRRNKGPVQDVAAVLSTAALPPSEIERRGVRVESEEPSPRVFFIRDVENPVRAPTNR